MLVHGDHLHVIVSQFTEKNTKAIAKYSFLPQNKHLLKLAFNKIWFPRRRR